MKALVSYVTSLGGTSAASAATPPASGASAPAPAKAEPAATAGPAKAAPVATPPASGGLRTCASQSGNQLRQPERRKQQRQVRQAMQPPPRGRAFSILNAAVDATEQSGGGGVGPALTHISSQYPPAKLTALLKAPTAKMKAAGMVPLTLNAADMKALVSYVTSLGGTSAASAATPPASGSSSTAPAKATRCSSRAVDSRVQRASDLQSTWMRRLSRDRWCRRYSSSPCACRYWQKLRACAPNHNAAASHRPHAARWNATGIPERRRIEGTRSICKLYFRLEKQSPLMPVCSSGTHSKRATGQWPSP